MPCAMPTGSQKFGNKTVSPFSDVTTLQTLHRSRGCNYAGTASCSFYFSSTFGKYLELSPFSTDIYKAQAHTGCTNLPTAGCSN